MASQTVTLEEIVAEVFTQNATSNDLVNPSVDREIDPYLTASTIMWGGAADPGWIADTSTSYLADVEGMANTPLNAFGESHSSSSFDVTIDTGEAFVGGAWLARDSTTTVRLSSSTNNQDVYVGWDAGDTNSVIIGKSEDFDSQDHKHKIWTFDTDGSGVTSSTDQRNLGRNLGTYEGINNTYDSDGDGTVDSTNIENNRTNVSDDTTQIVSETEDINFSSGNKVSDDGDNTVTVNIEPADFAGQGVEDDGSDNLRVANTAAGDGLSGGSGSSLDINVSDFVASGVEDNGSNDIRISSGAAGDGLKGGSGSALAIEPADFAGSHLSDDGSDNLQVDDDFVLNTGDTITGQINMEAVFDSNNSSGGRVVLPVGTDKYAT